MAGFYNFCGEDGIGGSGPFVGPYFGTCPVEASDDGQCLEYDADAGPYGICQPNGTSDVGEPCNPLYRFGAFSECTFGNYCVSNSSYDGGLCFPITVDGGCAGGEEPVAVGGDDHPNSITTQTGPDWAICALDCTTSKSCSAGPVGTSCQMSPGGTVSVCLP